MNTFLSANMDLLRCCMHVERLTHQYTSIRGNGGNSKIQLADLREYTFSGRMNRVYAYQKQLSSTTWRKEQRQFVICIDAKQDKAAARRGERNVEQVDWRDGVQRLALRAIQRKAKSWTLQLLVSCCSCIGVYSWTILISTPTEAVTLRTLAVEYTKTFVSRPRYFGGSEQVVGNCLLCAARFVNHTLNSCNPFEGNLTRVSMLEWEF